MMRSRRLERGQRRILHRPVAVVDAIDTQHIDSFPDVLRRTLLSGMSDEKEAGIPGAPEHATEFARRMADLRRIEADADEFVPVGQRGIERSLGIRLAEMAEETQDQSRLDPERRCGILSRAIEAVDDRGEGDAARRVGLRVEEHFNVADILGTRTIEIGQRQIVEILCGQQNRHAAIIDVEKILQTGEPVGLAQRLDGIVGDADAIASRQGDDELGLETALDVNMQLALRQMVDQAL